MSWTVPSGNTLAAAVAARHNELFDRFTSASAADLAEPSTLPRWDRLTIICHLRYGAQATLRMSHDCLSGRHTSFYPSGRDTQRPDTLVLRTGEHVPDLLRSFARACADLDQLWAGLDEDAWQTAIEEPPDNPDLGPITLWTLALLRLTEVEVHGTDLDLGLSDWSDTFVQAALPARLRWLPARRSNHQAADTTVSATWAFDVIDGPSYVVAATPTSVQVTRQADAPEADVVVRGSGQQLTAFLLGRADLDQLELDGPIAVARLFRQAFPPP